MKKGTQTCTKGSNTNRTRNVVDQKWQPFMNSTWFSVQVEEKGVFSLTSLKTFYQSICHRLKGTSTFRDSQNSHQDLAPLISDICHPLGTALLHSC